MDLYGLNGEEAGALGALPDYASTVMNLFHAASHHDVDALCVGCQLSCQTKHSLTLVNPAAKADNDSICCFASLL